MHVLINAASANMGGAVTYLRNMLRWLPIMASEDRFTVYVPRETKKKLADLDISPTVSLLEYPYADTGGATRIYFDQVFIPRLIRAQKVDFLFSSTGFGTFFSPCLQAVLIRNPVYFNEDFHTKYRQLKRSLRRNTIRRWYSLLSMHRADLVLFPTQAMQEMVESFMALDRKETVAIHYGFDHEAFLQTEDALPDIVSRMRRWKEEGYHLLLNVSTYAVHKNFETLIEALPRLITGGRRVKLLTTTSREKTTDKAEYDALRKRAVELGVDDVWIEIGYVTYQQLSGLYQAADLYLFPSFTESFGHTMVEAMAAGLPVVAADTPVNREVCGAAGSYFRTYDPQDCAKIALEILDEPEEMVRRSAISSARGADFSWQRYAQTLITLFHETAQIRY